MLKHFITSLHQIFVESFAFHIGPLLLYKRQALPFDPLRSAKSYKPFKKFDAHQQRSAKHTPPATTSQQTLPNMSSIDAIVNAGPSSQQLRDNDDDPAEKFDALNVREDSEGWNDVEEDTEEFNVQCLFCGESATSLVQALEHMKAEHQFDLVSFRSRQGG